MFGKSQNYAGHSCLHGTDKSPEYKRRRVFKIVCGLHGPNEPRVEYQDLLWEDCSYGRQADDPDARRAFTINHYILADRTSYRKTITVHSTAEDAIDKIHPFRGKDPFRIQSRKTMWNRLIVMSVYFISDIEYALRKNMYERQVSAHLCGTRDLPSV